MSGYRPVKGISRATNQSNQFDIQRNNITIQLNNQFATQNNYQYGQNNQYGNVNNFNQTQNNYSAKSTQNNQSFGIYPTLPEISQNLVGVSTLGWTQQTGESQNQTGKTKFIEQIGMQGLESFSQGNKQTTFGKSNPFQIWDLAAKNIPSNTNTNNQNQKQFISDQMQKNLSFYLNPIFLEAPQRQVFPSPFIKYKIIPFLDEKMALDITSVNDPKKKLKKNNAIIWNYHGGPNQLWYIKKEENYVLIMNVAKGFVLKVSQDGRDLANLISGPKIGTPNEKWKLNGSGVIYEIQSCATGKVLDLEQQRTSNGTSVIQWQKKSRGGSDNQKWRIYPA